jgi:hypothetical protein
MLVVTALLSAPAHAFIYVGNPSLGFRVDRPQADYVDGAVHLDKIRVHHCGGGYTDVTVDQTLDPVALNHVAIPAGDHCSLTWYWGGDLDVDGASYTVRYAEATTTVVLDAEIPPKSLSPYSVVSGSMSGGGPWLLSAIE